MPRHFAFLLCCGFVFYLLKCDKAKAPRVSWALWLPTIWLFVNATKSIDQWLGISGGSRESGGVIDPIAQVAFLSTGLMILGRRNFKWSAAIRENMWVVLLVGYMFLSITWSDTPFISLRRWIRELIALVMAFVVLSESAPRQVLESFLRRTVYVLIPFSALLVKYFPDLGVVFSRWTGEIQWIGVTLQKNGLGRLCLISVFFLVWTFIRRWKKRDVAVGKYQTGAEIILFVLTLWLLRGPSMWAASATAIACIVLGLAMYLGFLWIKKHEITLTPSTCVTFVGCIIGVGIITPFVGGATVTGFTSALGRNETLTGRTDIWAGVLPFFRETPFLGSGFGAFWTPETCTAALGMSEAHSGYLEVLLQLGLVGMFLTAMFLLSSTRKVAALLRYDYDLAVLVICFLTMAAIHNISESSFPNFTTQLTATILFLVVAFPRNIVRQTVLLDRHPVSAVEATQWTH